MTAAKVSNPACRTLMNSEKSHIQGSLPIHPDSDRKLACQPMATSLPFIVHRYSIRSCPHKYRYFADQFHVCLSLLSTTNGYSSKCLLKTYILYTGICVYVKLIIWDNGDAVEYVWEKNNKTNGNVLHHPRISTQMKPLLISVSPCLRCRF